MTPPPGWDEGSARSRGSGMRGAGLAEACAGYLLARPRLPLRALHSGTRSDLRSPNPLIYRASALSGIWAGRSLRFPSRRPLVPGLAGSGAFFSLYWETSERPGPHGPMSKPLDFIFSFVGLVGLFCSVSPSLSPSHRPTPPSIACCPLCPSFVARGPASAPKMKGMWGQARAPAPAPCFVRVVLSTRELSPKSCTKWLI